MRATVAEVRARTYEDHLAATAVAKTHGLSPADALHAIAASDCDAVASSDAAFDRIPGLRRLDFTKR